MTDRTRRPRATSRQGTSSRATVDLRAGSGSSRAGTRRGSTGPEHDDGAEGRSWLVGRRTAVIATVVAVTALLVALPARSYFRQQSEVATAREQLDEIEKANDELAARKQRLSDPDEISRIARRDYGLVEVGEESYSVLPPATAGLIMPNAWPFDRIEGAVRTAASGG